MKGYRLVGLALGLLLGTWGLVIGCRQPESASDGQGVPAEEISLTEEEFARAKQLFFNDCAGCHGTTRRGATGPHLLPEAPEGSTYPGTRQLGTAAIKAFITNGTPGGMPDWGRQGILSEEEIDLLARFLQLPPPPIPPMNLEDMRASWKVHVPVEQRPTRPQHNRNWRNFVGVVLRDAGKVAIIDGDTKELVSIVNTGFAVHILRSSASGRYFYSVGRDGKVTLIDLWMDPPQMVAEIKSAYDARSVDVSKYKGPKGDFIDKYAILGGYNPPHFVILDGLTLEPLKIIRTSGYDVNEGAFYDEARVASIVASHHDPLWVVNVKETGQIWLVDYSGVAQGKVSIDVLKAEQFLHDGGWDHTKRYFLVAANNKNKVVVVDVQEKEVEAIVETGRRPHPGRGANFYNPTYGHLWATGHLGDNTIALIATDPGPNQWKVVKKLELPGVGGGTLFIKTHPKSRHLWVDRTLNNDPELQRTIYVFDTETLELFKELKIPESIPNARAVHLEFNQNGDEVWVSAWGRKDDPSTNAILIYDDRTLELKQIIQGDWLITPTGKFNVYNTANDIY